MALGDILRKGPKERGFFFHSPPTRPGTGKTTLSRRMAQFFRGNVDFSMGNLDNPRSEFALGPLVGRELITLDDIQLEEGQRAHPATLALMRRMTTQRVQTQKKGQDFELHSLMEDTLFTVISNASPTKFFADELLVLLRRFRNCFEFFA